MAKLDENKCFFAFDEKQIEEGLKELNCSIEDVSSIGDGIFVLNSHLKEIGVVV